METRASYIAVGSFVLALLFALVVFVGWLGRISFDQDIKRYVIYFTGSVTGLQEGSAVRVRGIPVGSVVDIGFDPDNIAQVRVTVEVQADAPIRTNSVATLDIQGITGVPFVQISGGSQEAPPLEAERGAPDPVIPSRPSTIQAVIETVPALLERVTTLVDATMTILSPENQRAIAETLTNVQTITESLAGQTERFESLTGNVDGLVMELRVDAARISDRLDQTLTTASRAADDFEALAQTLNSAASEAERLVAEVRPGIVDFTGGGLPDLRLLITDLRVLSQNVSRVAERLERDPTLFLFGGADQGVRAD